MLRRDLLKRIGGIGALTAVSGTATAGGSVRTLRPDVSEFAHLDGVRVAFYDDGKVNVETDGTRPANPTQSRGYRVVIDAQDDRGRYSPEQASARVVPVPLSELQESSSGTGDADGGQTGSGSDVGTLGHSGGDGESDYQGGIYSQTEDPIDLDLAITETWIDWTASGGEVDWVRWKYHAISCDTAAGTTWYIEDAGHSYTSFYGTDVEVDFYGDYYNYDFGDDSERTETHHRNYVTGHPDGSMSWSTTHWSNGESSGNLHVDVGYFTNYDEHTNHCYSF